MKLKKNTLYIAVVLLVVVIGGYFVMSNGDSINDVAATDGGDGEAQKIVLSIKNYNYYPQEVKVKVNQPVRIYLDNSVTGCFRSFTIRDFGVAKNLPTAQDYVEFTPDKTGRFTFACSMGMGTGTLVVE